MFSGFVAYKKERSWALPDTARLLYVRNLSLDTSKKFFMKYYSLYI